MSAAPFDIPAFARRPEEGGFPVEQSRAAAAALADASTDRTAAPGDPESFEGSLHRDVDSFKAEIREDIALFQTGMRAAMQALEQRLTVRIGGMPAVATGMLPAADLSG
jgi:hypothetical protein